VSIIASGEPPHRFRMQRDERRCILTLIWQFVACSRLFAALSSKEFDCRVPICTPLAHRKEGLGSLNGCQLFCCCHDEELIHARAV